MAPNTTEMDSIENRDPGDEDRIQADKDRMTSVWAGLRTTMIEDSEYNLYRNFPLDYKTPACVEGTYSYRFKITVR